MREVVGYLAGALVGIAYVAALGVMLAFLLVAALVALTLSPALALVVLGIDSEKWQPAWLFGAAGYLLLWLHVVVR